jgi:hypothetical protein
MKANMSDEEDSLLRPVRTQTSLNLLLKRSKEHSNFVRRRGPRSLSMLFGDVKRASKKKIKESQYIILRGQKNLKKKRLKNLHMLVQDDKRSSN